MQRQFFWKVYLSFGISPFQIPLFQVSRHLKPKTWFCFEISAFFSTFRAAMRIVSFVVVVENSRKKQFLRRQQYCGQDCLLFIFVLATPNSANPSQVFPKRSNTDQNWSGNFIKEHSQQKTWIVIRRQKTSIIHGNLGNRTIYNHKLSTSYKSDIQITNMSFCTYELVFMSESSINFNM